MATDSNLPYNEPGATDNRLSLNPSQFEGMEDWQDGETYNLKDVRIKQISQGEFEVISATVAPKEEAEEPGTEEQVEGGPMEGSEAKTPSDYPNPAVAKMMGGGRK